MRQFCGRVVSVFFQHVLVLVWELDVRVTRIFCDWGQLFTGNSGNAQVREFYNRFAVKL